MLQGSRFVWIILAVACVFAAVLFPAPMHHGPFTAVYGPATDLRSSIDVRQALPLLLTAMVVASITTPLAPAHPELVHRDFATEHSPTLPQRASVLRC
jgi:hypothetical protein